LWFFLALALQLTIAEDETAAPVPAGEQNMAMSPPEFPEIMPQPYDTPTPNGYPTEYTPPQYPQETPPPGMEQPYSPDNPNMHSQQPTDQEEETLEPTPVTGADGMTYTTISPMYYTRGITRKTRWGSNRNTVKRYNNLNPGGTNSQRGRKAQMDRQEGGAGDGIMTQLKYRDKWNRVGVIRSGD